MNNSEIYTVIASLLAEQKIPALDERQYQDLTQYLFATADSPLRLQVAEAVFRNDRQHPQARGLFLACACPLAQRMARRVAGSIFPQPPDLTEELLYNGAVNRAVKMFQQEQIPNEINFGQALYVRLKTGAMQAAFHRSENRGVSCTGKMDHYARGPRVEEQLIASEILERIAALEPQPETARIYRFLRCLVDLGPDYALKPSPRDPARRNTVQRPGARRNRSPRQWLDLEPIMKAMGISRSAARQYLFQARAMLREMFNADGMLFVKGGSRNR